MTSHKKRARSSTPELDLGCSSSLEECTSEGEHDYISPLVNAKTEVVTPGGKSYVVFTTKCLRDTWTDGKGYDHSSNACGATCSFWHTPKGRTYLYHALVGEAGNLLSHYQEYGKGSPYGPTDLYALVKKEYPVERASRSIHQCLVVSDQDTYRVVYYVGAIVYWYGESNMVQWVLTEAAKDPR